jgi:hypothetical protein
MISDILHSVALEPITDIPTSAGRGPSFSLFLLFHHRDQKKKNYFQVHLLWHFSQFSNYLQSRAEVHSASILHVSSMFNSSGDASICLACLNHRHLGDCTKTQPYLFSSTLIILLFMFILTTKLLWVNLQRNILILLGHGKA